MEIKNLQPECIWRNFDALTQVPRPRRYMVAGLPDGEDALDIRHDIFVIEPLRVLSDETWHQMPPARATIQDTVRHRIIARLPEIELDRIEEHHVPQVLLLEDDTDLRRMAEHPKPSRNPPRPIRVIADDFYLCRAHRRQAGHTEEDIAAEVVVASNSGTCSTPEPS